MARKKYWLPITRKQLDKLIDKRLAEGRETVYSVTQHPRGNWLSSQPDTHQNEVEPGKVDVVQTYRVTKK